MGRIIEQGGTAATVYRTCFEKYSGTEVDLQAAVYIGYSNLLCWRIETYNFLLKNRRNHNNKTQVELRVQVQATTRQQASPDEVGSLENMDQINETNK